MKGRVSLGGVITGRVGGTILQQRTEAHASGLRHMTWTRFNPPPRIPAPTGIRPESL